MSSDLDQQAIERALCAAGARMGHPLTVLAVTGSTNSDAREAARRGAPSGAAFVANEQLEGRGRFGRVWHSPAGTNLYVSFVLRPNLAASLAPSIPLCAGLAIADSLAPLAGSIPTTLKWPNDVLLGGRKVAGVLSEAELVNETVRFVVVGIGINVGLRTFPPELESVATSLALRGVSVSRDELLVALCLALDARLSTLEASGIEPLTRDFARRDALVGKSVVVEGETLRAVGITPEGRYRVIGPGELTRDLAAGEITLGATGEIRFPP